MTQEQASALRRLQQQLQRHLMGRDSSIADAILEAPPLPTAERLRIYRNAYSTRLIEALQETFPVTHQLLGDEVFASLGRDFLDTHPSVHRSIRWYGAELARFMAENAPYQEQPVLSEVALLEWTLSEVFDAEDCVALGADDLASVPADAWSELQFEFHPSMRRLELLWNAVPIWQALNREDAPPEPHCAAATTTWVLWRKDFKNFFRSLTGAEADALDAAIAGSNFAEICESLRDWLPEEEIPLTAANYLAVWTGGGIIVSLS